MVFVVAMGVGCSGFAQQGLPDHQPVVVVHGALKDMMMHGDVSAKAALGEYSGNRPWWGLGAVAGLKGEVFIGNGVPWVSQAIGPERVEVLESPSAKATLLVAAEVPAWSSHKVPRRVRSQADLESFLRQKAEQAGLDVEAPFPFRLTGVFDQVQWHVVNWVEGDMEHTCEKHKTTGPHGTLASVEGEVLGFHSLHHHRIFTHHSTNVHMHLKTKGLVAHVDGLVLRPNTLLWLPAAAGKK